MIPERSSETPSQRRNTLNRLKNFDDNFEDDELNLKDENARNFKEMGKEKEKFQQYSIEGDSS